MKTTVLLDDEIYKRLVDESIRMFGSAKNISAVLNKKLREAFFPTQKMFGKLKPFSLKGLREKRDRFD